VPLVVPCPAGGIPASPENGGFAAFRFIFRPGPNKFSPHGKQNGLQIEIATRFPCWRKERDSNLSYITQYIKLLHTASI